MNIPNRIMYRCAPRHMYKNAHTFKKSQYTDISLAQLQNPFDLTFIVPADSMQLLVKSVRPCLWRAPHTSDFLPRSLSDLGFPWETHACTTWKNRSYAGGITVGQWEVGANGQWINVSTFVLPGEQFWNAFHMALQKMLAGPSTSSL